MSQIIYENSLRIALREFSFSKVGLFVGQGACYKPIGHSIILIQLKDGIGRLFKVFGNFQCQHRGRNVFAGLNGVDGVPAHADGIRQLLLGDVLDGSFYSDCVLHKAYCFLDFQSIHLNIP